MAEPDPPADAPPTTDELLLELLDLGALAFPQALHHLAIDMVPSEDAARPALTNLDGKARADAPRRPELGFADDEVLDTINHVLTLLADATERAAGVRVLEGRLTFDDDGDGGKRAVLSERRAGTTAGTPAGALEPVMERRFDRSELRWLLYTPALFSRLNDSERVEENQRAAVESALAGYRRFDIDMRAARITFHDPTGARPAQPWRFELLGSYNEDTEGFLWGWANEQVHADVRSGVEALRRSSTADGLRCFTDEAFGCPVRLAERLCRSAATTMRSFGVYPARFASEQGKGVMYLALFPT